MLQEPCTCTQTCKDTLENRLSPGEHDMLQAQGLLDYADTSAVMHKLTLSVHDQTFINNSISKALSLLPV